MLKHLLDATNVAYTENGAKSFATTGDELLNLFAQGGALRTGPKKDTVDASKAIRMFTAAYGEDSLLAMKMLFYFRDVRGGQGERQLFRIIAKYLANAHAASMAKNVHLVSEFGRWDDVYVFRNTKIERVVADVIKSQWMKDEVAEYPSLQGKWLASENASSAETISDARWTMKILGLTPRQYRKGLAIRRAKIKIVENLMSEKRWDEIEYDKLPSKAGLQYRKAFQRNDSERYDEFLASLQSGEKKVNSKTLYPYELVQKILYTHKYTYNSINDLILYDEMWKALPDYFNGKDENSLVVVDTSGSMSGVPITVAISLGLYAAERNKGVFHNTFMTFSATPTLVTVKGKTLAEKIVNMSRADAGMNTDVEAVFDLLLNTAVNNNVHQSELPKKIYVVSDMEFDSERDRDANARGWNNPYDQVAFNRTDKALFRKISDKFKNAGYEMPLLVFWNVDARNEQHPMTMDDRGVMFVSGCSPSIFTNLLKDNITSAIDLMLDVLNSERYSAIQV